MTVLDKHVAALQIRQSFRIEPAKAFARHGLIHGAPTHGGFGELIAHDELVFRTPAGELPGVYTEGAATREQPFLAPNRVLQKLSSSQIPIRAVEIPDTMGHQTAVLHRSLYHNGIVMLRAICLILAATLGGAQVIEFESGGLKYQTLTKSSVTVMFAHLPARVHEFAIIQVAVSNGAQSAVVVRPEDITVERAACVVLQAH